jgi:hypothetical protein
MTTNHTRALANNGGMVLTQYIKARDKSTLVLSYTHGDAAALRALVASIHLKNGTRASMALVARRSLQLYRELLQRPDAMASETEALNRMTTPTPSPAPLHTRKNLRKAPQGRAEGQSLTSQLSSEAV